MKALITDYTWPSVDIEKGLLKEAGVETIVAPATDKDTLIDLSSDVDAIMFCFAHITQDILNNATKCKIAARYGVGLDNIDIDTCTKLGIVVTSVPDYCISEVSDHVFAMLLTLNRRIVQHNNSVRALGWSSVSLNSHIIRTSESIIGIIGFGRIGREVARKARTFGMQILTYDPILEIGTAVDGAKVVTMEQLLKESDFVTLHIPLNSSTYKIIGATQLESMKQTAILINCSRAGIIDEKALVQQLNTGKLGGVGLDVVEDMSLNTLQPLLNMDNVIITPHTAFFSQHSVRELQRKTALSVTTLLAGKVPTNLVNPQVIGRSRAGI